MIDICEKFELSKQLTMLLPLIPISVAVSIITLYYMFKKDISKPLIPITVLSVIGAIVALITLTEGVIEFTIPLNKLPYSIHFLMDNTKIYFMATLIPPLIFSIFHLHQLDSIYARVIFLFYLTGCTGIVVSGDIFNFFVFFELMIMAAYVLISLNKDYYASIKYMFFGSLGATFLLSAVIVWFRSGHYFSYSEIVDFAISQPDYAPFLLMLLSMVFLIKGGIFPVSSWPGPCHGAAPTLVASFLSSFSTFTAVYGFHYFVIIPAQEAQIYQITAAIETLSLITIATVSLFALFENRFRYMISTTTPITVSIVLLMLIGGEHRAAMSYMVIHSIYKSSLFVSSLYSCDNEQKSMEIKLSLPTLITLLTGAIFTASLFPALTALLKDGALPSYLNYELTLSFSSLILVTSFAKFSYRVNFKRATLREYSLLIVLISLLVFTYLNFTFEPASLWKSSIQILILISGIIIAKRLFNSLPTLHRFDSRVIYKTLNHELFTVPLIFVLLNFLIKIN